LGISIACGFLLARCAFDGIFMVTWGFPPGSAPLWQTGIWWPEIVNATLLGYMPAALVNARRGVEIDLSALRPWLRCSDAQFEEVRHEAIRPPGRAGRAFIGMGFVGTIAFVVLDPSVSGAEPSLTNPGFMWPLVRIPIFLLAVCLLTVADLNATRVYSRIGKNLIEVDLLDIQALAPFARRGLRSALMWIIFLIIFSLFWLGEGTASRQNPIVFALVFSMAIGAFVVPLLGVRYSIQSAKHSELGRLRDEIRVERAAAINKRSDETAESPRLANLIAYHQLVDHAREWPIDAANLLRFFMYLLIGLGSWLGGAVVERLLDTVIGA